VVQRLPSKCSNPRTFSPPKKSEINILLSVYQSLDYLPSSLTFFTFRICAEGTWETYSVC
jgi:hypothetical protein